jgi:hypothetical protein
MPLDTSSTSNAKAAAAFITLAASALVITAATNTMFPKKNAADADAPVVPPEPNLSSRYQLGKFENSRSESLFTLHLPSTTNESSSPSAMLVLAHGLAEHCCRPRCKCSCIVFPELQRMITNIKYIRLIIHSFFLIGEQM